MLRATLTAFVFSFILVMLYFIVILIQPIVGDTLASTLQLLDSLLALVSFSFGAAYWVYKSLEEPRPLNGVKEFRNLFPPLSGERPEMVKEWPRLVDFEDDYVVRPPDTYQKLIKTLGLSEGGISNDSITGKQVRERYRAAVLAGPSGCGKTVTSLRLGYDLSRKGWRVYFCDAVELFSYNSMNDIRTWFSSLRGKRLFIIDNAHLSTDKIEGLLETLKDTMEKTRVVRPSRFRVLCILTYVYLPPSSGPRRSKHFVGRPVTLLQAEPDSRLGLGALPVTTADRTGLITIRYPALQITEGRDIGQAIFTRFFEVENIKTDLDFETLFRETGTVVELCEILRRIRQQSIDHEDMQNKPPWVDAPVHALARRAKAATDRPLGVLVLGVVSAFSQVGSIVAREFVQQILSRDISQTITELARAGHLVTRQVGASMHEYLVLSHPIVAIILRRGCSSTLGDFFGIDDPLGIDLRLYRDYFAYIKTLPRTASQIGSSFLLTLSSHSADKRIGPIVDFVVDESRAYPQKDTNIGISLYNAGVYYFESDDLKKAEQLFLDTIELVPDYHHARVNLGALYFLTEEMKKARDILEGIPEAQRDASANANLGLVFHRMGDYARGIQMLVAATTLQPQEARYWHSLAAVEANSGNDAAEEHFQKAIELDPKNGDYYVSLSNFLIKGHENGEAVELLMRALAEGVLTPNMLVNLGVALQNQGRTSEAKIHFVRCLEIDPSCALAHANLASVLNNERNLPEALLHTEEALRFDPNLGGAYAILGQIMQERRELTASARAYEQAISKGCETHELVRNLAFVYYDLRKLKLFKDRLERAISLADNPALVLLDSFIFLSDRKDRLAQKYSVRATELINSYLKDKVFDKAEAALGLLSKITPKNPVIWANLGAMRAGLGKFIEAREVLETAVRLGMDSPWLWHNLGNVYMELRQEQEARDAYAKARDLAGGPDHYGAYFTPDKGWNVTS